MPTRPKKTCNQPGCRNLTYQTYCDEHKNKLRKEFDNKRGNSAQRGYDHRWRKYRKMYLAHHPLCVDCKKNNRISLATVVDHIVPHKGDYELMWDVNNHQALCKPCHDVKTGKEQWQK